MAPCLRIFNAKTRKRRESVGRAVHCTPEALALAQPIGSNLDYPRPYERGYGARPSRSQEPLRPGWPRAKSAQRRAGVHARRSNTAFNTTTSPNFTAPELSWSKKAPTRSIHLEGTAAKMAALQSILARDRADRRRPAARMAARHSTITVARPYRSDAWAMYPYPEKISFRWYGRMAACVRIFNAKTQRRRAR